MPRTSYYDIPPLPVLSVIDADTQAHPNTPRRVLREDEDFELMKYQKARITATNCSTDVLFQGYEKPLLDHTTRTEGPSRIAQQDKEAQRTSLWHKAALFPFFTYTVSIIDIVLFIVELIRSKSLTGSAFVSPSANPMLGPSTNVMIYMGSRFTPCAMSSHYVNENYSWPCPNSTSSISSQECSLAEMCNFRNDGQAHSQLWRILSACFLHAGFVHIIFNLILQMLTGREVELQIGTLRYMVIYICSGLSGNLFGLNFAGDGISSVGASGALFGVIAVNIILFILYKDRAKIRGYACIFVVMCLEVVVTLALGLLPGLDNFAHIGGFICGLLMSFIILDDPRYTKHRMKMRRKLHKKDYYDNPGFLKQLWSWYTLVRLVSLCLLIAWFVGLGINIKNGGGHCSWCKYLSCIPVNGWCEQSELSTS